jgi:hypothetical protein
MIDLVNSISSRACGYVENRGWSVITAYARGLPASLGVPTENSFFSPVDKLWTYFPEFIKKLMLFDQDPQLG